MEEHAGLPIIASPNLIIWVQSSTYPPQLIHFPLILLPFLFRGLPQQLY